MKKNIIIFIILSIVTSVAIYAYFKNVADNFTAYDYIKQEKDGYDSVFVKERFKDIEIDYNPVYSKFDPNLIMDNGYTLLTYAAYKKDFDFMDMLIDYKKADVHKKDKNGNSILTILIKQKKYEKASYYMSNYNMKLTKDEREKFLKSIEKFDENALPWCLEHNIPFEGVVSNEIINIFKKNYLKLPLDEISDSYEKIRNIFNDADRRVIYDSIVSTDDNLETYHKLLSMILKDGVTISATTMKSKKNNYLNIEYRYVLSKLSILAYFYEANSSLFNADDRLRIFKFLIEYGAKYEEHKELLAAILKDGVEVKQDDKSWEYYLREVISNNQINNMQVLLKYAPLSQKLKDELIYIAIDDWSKDMTMFLLEQNLKIGDKDVLSDVILHGWTSIAQILINEGEKVNKPIPKYTLGYLDGSLELFKVLYDNNYPFTKAQYEELPKIIKSQGSFYFNYALQDKIYLALTSDSNDSVYAARLDNQKHKISIEKLTSELKEEWSYELPSKAYQNAINNVAGLYYFFDNLILIQNKLELRKKKTILTKININSKKTKEIQLDGVFKKIVFSESKFLIETEQVTKVYDKNIDEIKEKKIYLSDEFNTTKRYKREFKELYRNDRNIRTKYLQNKSVVLNYYSSGDVSKLHVDLQDTNTTKIIDLAKKDTVVLDITQTKNANYIIAQTLSSSKIKKLTLDYGEFGYHYIKQSKEENSISSMKHITSEIKLKNGNSIVVGQNDLKPTLEIFDTTGKKLLGKSYQFSYMNGHITTVKELGNNDIVIVGRIYQKDNFRKVFAALLNEKGEPKWSRIYDDYSYIDNIELSKDNSFVSLANYSPLKLSLKDGSVLKKYKEIIGADNITMTPSGYIYAVGKEKPKRYTSSDVYLPIIYCYSKNAESLKKSIVGDEEYSISNIYSEGEDVYAEFEFLKTEGSLSSNKIITRITKECKLQHKWEK